MTRRTQAERRAATVAKLLQATTEALHEVGYARTTTKEVCLRAGVSQGGLFRHFPTRLALIAATADHVAATQIAAFEKDLLTSPLDRIEAAIRAVRARCHSPINSVWHELMLASRTDLALREAIGETARQYRSDIEAIALSVLGSIAPPETVTAAAWLVIHAFDGEAIGGALLGTEDSAEQRVRWVSSMLRAVASESLVTQS